MNRLKKVLFLSILFFGFFNVYKVEAATISITAPSDARWTLTLTDYGQSFTSNGNFFMEGLPDGNYRLDIIQFPPGQSCTGGGSAYGGTLSTVISCVPPPPVVSLSASPSTIIRGQATTLTWSSSDASATCTYNGNSVPTSGSQGDAPVNTTTYRVVCTNAGGPGERSVTVTVNLPPPPTVDLKMFPTNNFGARSDGPLSINYNTSVGAYGACTNATAFELYVNEANQGDRLIAFTPDGAGVSNNVFTITKNTVFTLNCSGPGGLGQDRVSVNVVLPSLTGDIKINDSNSPGTIPYNSNITIGWNSQNADSCNVISNGVNLGQSDERFRGTNKAPFTFGPLTISGQYTVILRCSGPGGIDKDVDSVSITVAPPNVVCDLKLFPMSNTQNRVDGTLNVTYGASIGLAISTLNTKAVELYIDNVLTGGTLNSNNEGLNVTQITKDTNFKLRCQSIYDLNDVREDTILARPTIGRIEINSNIDTTWNVSGPENFSGSGMRVIRDNSPFGTYFIVPANKPGFTWTVKPCANQILSANPSCN